MGEMVQGIRVPDRAPTLSFPINPVTITAAAGVIGEVAGRVGDALAFDRVLRQQPGVDTGASPGQVDHASDLGPAGENWLERVVTRLRQVLRGANIETPPTLDFVATGEGQLSLAQDHPRGAEIEAILGEDSDLASLVRNWVRQTGDVLLSVSFTPDTDLTRRAAGANMEASGEGSASSFGG